MKKRNTFTAMLAGLMIGAGAVYAHEAATLDKLIAPNGGQLRQAGSYHYELVVVKPGNHSKDNPLLVYVTNHGGQKIPTAGASGTATILVGIQKTTIELAPDGDNRMKGVGAYESEPEMKAIVSITLAGKSVEQARFTPLVQAAE